MTKVYDVKQIKVKDSDFAKIKVHGSGLERVPVNCPASFIVDTGGIDVGEVHCTILGPNQTPLKHHFIGNYHSGYKIEYTPTEAGMYFSC